MDYRMTVKRPRLVVPVIIVQMLLLAGCKPTLEDRWSRELVGIDSIVADEIEQGHIPGAVVLVGRPEKILYHKAFGLAVSEPYQQQMRKDTIFDIASLTKPVSTAASIMILADRGLIGPNDLVGKYIPSFACNGKEQVRIRHLLTHTSGLPAYTSAAELEKSFGNPCPDKVIEKICSLEALSEPGEDMHYSCLGYITLAKIVEVVSGKSIDRFSRENLFGPLGMKHTVYTPPTSWTQSIAATEIVDGEPLRGTVHDPLARLAGGVSGNAGVFSTAHDLAVYCSALLGRSLYKGKRILSPEAVALITTAQSHGRAFGFDVSSGYSWIKGEHTSEKAYCHSGYTGTSIVCDPAVNVYLIILTNRVHPNDKGTSRSVRVRVADLVFQTCTDQPKL